MENAPVPEMIEMDANVSDDEGYLKALSDHFEPLYTKGIDLFSHPPARFFLFAFPHGTYVIAMLAHHSGLDGSTIFELFRTFFSEYHLLVTGERPDWHHTSSLASSSAREAPRYSVLKQLREILQEQKRYETHPVIMINGIDEITSPVRIVSRFKLDRSETASALKKAKSLGLTFNDLVCLETITAFDDFLGVPEGTLSFWIPVNLRGMTKGHDGRANHSTSINIDLIREERLDRTRMMKAFTEKRKYLMKSGRAQVNMRLLETVVRCSQYFPVEFRKPYLRKLYERPKSLVLSNFGVVWARKENGRPTSESLLESAGGLEVQDFGISFSIERTLGHGLLAYTYRGCFTCVLSMYKELLEEEQAGRIMESIRARLVS